MAEEHVVHTDGGNGGMGFVVGILILIVFLFFFFYYGLPAIQQSGSPQINIPDKVDVNVNQK